MPIALWLLLGSVAAYLVYQSGKAAAVGTTVPPALASSTSGSTIAITDSSGHTYTVPIDTNLPASVQQQIQTFFRTAGLTDAQVSALSTSLSNQGYTVTAGSMQSVWQMIQQGLGPLVQGGTSSSSDALASAGTGTGISGGGYANPFSKPSSSAPDYSKVPTPPINLTKTG